MQRKRSLLIIVSVILALVIVFFISGSLSAPENNQPSAAYQDGQPVVIDGEIVCLPHRDQTGPVTLECAYGLKDGEGNYYGLSDTTPEHSMLSDVSTNSQIRIEGIFRTSDDDKYQQIGTIEVKAVVE